MNIDQLFVATKAFIINNDRILIIRESGEYADGTNTGRYDLPGGRVKARQRFDQSLIREIKEETGLKVTIGRPFYVDEWRPKVRQEQWQIIGIYFECHGLSDKVELSRDHDDYQWIEPLDYHQYPLTQEAQAAFGAYLEYIQKLAPTSTN